MTKLKAENFEKQCVLCNGNHSSKDSYQATGKVNSALMSVEVCIDCTFQCALDASPETMGNCPVEIKPKQFFEVIAKDKYLKATINEMIFSEIEQYTNNREANLVKQIQKEPQRKYTDSSSIYESLNEHIIGQSSAKKAIALAVERYTMSHSIPSIKKVNTMLIGPTGTGKTEIVRVLAKTLQAPMIKVDCSQLVAAAYKGKSVGDILDDLFSEAKHNKEKTEKGIIFLDEFDKILLKAGENGSSRIQSELLKLIEGDKFYLESNGPGKGICIDSSKILVIAAGSFEHIRKHKVNKKANVGLRKDKIVQVDKKISKEDLKRAGVLPELLGRFSYLEELNPLCKTTLKRIFTSVKESLVSEYTQIIKLKGVDYNLDDAEIDSIVEEALREGLGARGLRAVVERRFCEKAFKIETKESNLKLVA